MLNVESRFMIKELHQQGVTISEIARRTGHDRKTIRTVLNGSILPVASPHPVRPTKLEPFIPHLKQRIAEGVVNCNKLLAEIRQQGYQGGKSLVKNFVQPYRATRQPVATVRFETEPGQQAQVDWGHFGFIEHHGSRHRLYAFVMTLGWSRTSYLEFTISADAAWWLRCHVHAFEYFGGVPRVVLHDNLKTAVLERTAAGAIHWHPRYLDFAGYYGFSPRACQPYRAQTKGKVEAGVKYVRRNFWPGLKFCDLADLNRQARDWLDGTANVRVHGTTGAVPFERLPLEHLPGLLDKPAYDTSLISFRRVTRDCLVSYDSNYYSVPAAYAGKTLKLRATEDGQLSILNAQDEPIAEYQLVSGHHQRNIVLAHYAAIGPGARPAPRPTASQWPAASSLPGPAAAPEVERRPLCWYDQLTEALA
jgi:transposase